MLVYSSGKSLYFAADYAERQNQETERSLEAEGQEVGLE